MAVLTLDTIFPYLQVRPLVLNQEVEVTEQVYDYFLGILPPIYVTGGFCVCEAITGAVYSKFVEREGRFFHSYVELVR